MKIMTFVGKESRNCDCCDKYKHYAPVYKWYSIITEEFLGIVCHKCAVREQFGSKKSRRYYKWLEEMEKEWKKY